MADSLDLMRARRVAMSEAAICERNKAIEQILRWCDRSGEEPEGQCLHEIEQICRKQLGLELLRPAITQPEPEDTATVRRIWGVLGIANYADAKGMSIVEHVADLKRRAELWERLHDARTDANRPTHPDEVSEHVRLTPREGKTL